MRLVGDHHGDSIDLELPLGVTIAGRSGTNGLVIPSQTVSRRHAEIRATDEGVQVRDLGSLNGTRVNGQAAVEATPIHAGDIVEFGSVRFRAMETGDEATAGPPVAWAEDREVSSSVQISGSDISAEKSLGTGIDPKIFRMLTEAGQMLVLPESPDETFDRLLELVEDVVPAERIIVLETNDVGEPVQRAARARGDRALGALLLSRTMVGLVMEERRSILTSDAQADERFMHQQSIVAQNLRSAMAVPLIHGDESLGVLYIDTNDPRAAYTENDLQVLTLLGQMLGAKIANTRLLEVARERERLEEELRTAAGIQKRLLPQTLPEVEGYDLIGCQETCEAVGGDLYDAGLLPDGRLQVVLGDVSGKGIPAALLMSDVLSMIRALRPFGLPPAELVERIHRHVLANTETERYLTLFLAEIDPVSHRMEYVNAGHPPGRLVAADGTAVDLDSTGAWVGLIDLPGIPFESRSVEFAAGSVLVITSDGIDEAMRGDDEFYGDRRLGTMLGKCAGGDACDVCRQLVADVESFRGDAPATDDVTVVVVHRAGSDADTGTDTDKGTSAEPGEAS